MKTRHVSFSRIVMSGAVVRSLRILDTKARRRIILVVIIQITLSFIDLFAIALVGMLGAITIRGIKSENPGDKVNTVLSILRISELSFQKQVAILGLVTALLLVSKTFLSIYFTKRILYFLSKKSALISKEIFAWYLSGSLVDIQKISSQDFLFSVTTGVRSVTMGIIGSIVSISTDLSLLIIMFSGLLIVDPAIALISLALFSCVGYFLFKVMKSKAQKLGSDFGELSIKSNEKILESLLTYREIVVRHRRKYYLDEVDYLMEKMSIGLAEMTFLPNISKYVIETTVVVSSLLICGWQFALTDSTQAIATLSIFLAAATRIAPAILRTQQAMILIKGSFGTASNTLNLLDSVHMQPRENLKEINQLLMSDEFVAEVKIEDIMYSHTQDSSFKVEVDKLTINQGTSIAFVGFSGAGKTTLVDLILGILQPEQGSIKISGLEPLDAIQTWQGSISYVPQDVQIIEGTIRENIELGFKPGTFSDTQILAALNKANLLKLVEESVEGLEAKVGERGAKISGGQRQRLGIARALITEPKLLVMDEATSALDSETELAISATLRELKGKVTVIMIAHRLSTIKECDLICYLENGRIRAKGSFNEVRSNIPDFDRQASLMGL